MARSAWYCTKQVLLMANGDEMDERLVSISDYLQKLGSANFILR